MRDPINLAACKVSTTTRNKNTNKSRGLGAVQAVNFN
jgi:hypothetical protein